ACRSRSVGAGAQRRGEAAGRDGAGTGAPARGVAARRAHRGAGRRPGRGPGRAVPGPGGGRGGDAGGDARRSPRRSASGPAAAPRPRKARPRGPGVTYAQVSLAQVFLSLWLIALALAISARERLGLELDLVVGTVRAAVQLFAIGVVLTLLFRNERPGWVLALLAGMVVVAGWTAARRIEHGPGTAGVLPVATPAGAVSRLVVPVPPFPPLLPPPPPCPAP